MAEQIGYVSSFLVSEGVGFIRRGDDPRELVLFHRSAVDDEVVDDIAEGLEVAFELDPDAAAEGGWPVVRSVKAPTPDPADGVAKRQKDPRARKPRVKIPPGNPPSR